VLKNSFCANISATKFGSDIKIITVRKIAGLTIPDRNPYMKLICKTEPNEISTEKLKGINLKLPFVGAQQ
jgi:hypothetical protein